MRCSLHAEVLHAEGQGHGRGGRGAVEQGGAGVLSQGDLLWHRSPIVVVIVVTSSLHDRLVFSGWLPDAPDFDDLGSTDGGVQPITGDSCSSCCCSSSCGSWV